MGVLRTTEIAEPRMLRPDGCVIEAGRNGMCQLDVPRVVLQYEGSRSLENTCTAARESCRMAARRDFLAARFDADQSHGLVVEEAVEDADGVTAATDARDHHVR